MLIAEDADVSPLATGAPLFSVRGLAVAPGESLITEVSGVPVVAVSNPRSGRTDADVWALSPLPDGALEAALKQAGYELETEAEFDAARIANGVPLFGRDFGPDTLPQEAGLHDALHWGKGCYIGQETVARLGHRGQTGRELRVVEVGGAATPGDIVVFGDDRVPVGTITSATWGEYGVVAIAMLKRKAFVPGTRLVVITAAGDVSGEVSAKPIREFTERRPWNSPDFKANRPHTALRG